ncbi:MAG: HD domain-containing protein [Patescibacteria group bacterium]
MKNLIKLLSVLQLTKDQPLTGYISSGIKLHETPSLAEHHYTTILMAYLIAQKIKEAGGAIEERKIILMTMIHDLPELFGGDISAPLNRKYPDLREYKNKIGERAIAMLASHMDEPTRKEFVALHQELNAGATDEAVVCKIMDQMDHQLFLEYHNHKLKYNQGSRDYRPDFFENHIIKLAEKIKDAKTKKVMADFLTEFRDNFFDQGFQGMSVLME